MYVGRICRICLESGDLKPIFSTNCTKRVRMTCAEALVEICRIPVKEDDGLPKFICKKCFGKLKSAYKLRILCEESYAKLTDGKFSSNLVVDINKSDENIKCDSGFKNEILDVTKNIEKSSDPYFCEICKKNFKSETKHIEFHQKTKQLQCEICAKVFLRAATLRMHLLVHKNEKPFKCTFPNCNKAFPQNNRLQSHLKVHTDERNFICHYCSHAARDKQQLTVHIRYFHTKEKNYLCGECGKAFVSPQARYYHVKRHQNIRNHHCPHCEKSFIFAFGLQEHLVTHTGEKRFACSSCDARFSRKAHKEKHENRLHGINRMS